MKTKLLSLMAAIVMIFSFQSCGSSSGLGQGAYGLNFVKNILLNGTNQGLGVWGSPKDFVVNALIDAAMPSSLRDINNKLQSIGMGSLVQKEKEYIAQAAQFTASNARPILTQAIQQMTATDAVNIIAGGKNAGTQYLKNKTYQQLITTLQPKVDTKLNESGLVKSLGSALNNSSLGGILGNILGGGQNNASGSLTGSISKLASEQMINGLFNIVENYEVNTRNQPGNILKSIGGK